MSCIEINKLVWPHLLGQVSFGLEVKEDLTHFLLSKGY